MQLKAQEETRALKYKTIITRYKYGYNTAASGYKQLYERQAMLTLAQFYFALLQRPRPWFQRAKLVIKVLFRILSYHAYLLRPPHIPGLPYDNSFIKHSVVFLCIFGSSKNCDFMVDRRFIVADRWRFVVKNERRRAAVSFAHFLRRVPLRLCRKNKQYADFSMVNRKRRPRDGRIKKYLYYNNGAKSLRHCYGSLRRKSRRRSQRFLRPGLEGKVHRIDSNGQLSFSCTVSVLGSIISTLDGKLIRNFSAACRFGT